MQECDDFCFGQRFSLSALSRNGICACSSMIPDDEVMLPDSECRLKGGAALYYHFASGCRGARAAAMQLPWCPMAGSGALHTAMLLHWPDRPSTTPLQTRTSAAGCRPCR